MNRGDGGPLSGEALALALAEAAEDARREEARDASAALHLAQAAQEDPHKAFVQGYVHGMAAGCDAAARLTSMAAGVMGACEDAALADAEAMAAWLEDLARAQRRLAGPEPEPPAPDG